MDKKIVGFLLMILSVNTMLLIGGVIPLTSDSTQSFYSSLPSDYQNRVSLGETDLNVTGGESDLIKGFVSSIPFLSGVVDAGKPIVALIDLAGKLSFGWFHVIDVLAAPGTGMNMVLNLVLIPVGILQVIFMAYLLLYIIAVVAGWRP